MEKRRLLPSRKRKILLIFAAIVICLALLIIVSEGGVDGKGWVFILILIAAVISQFINMLPGASWLELDEKGLTIRNLFRERSYSWNDIDEFRIKFVRFNKVSVFDFVNEAKNRHPLDTEPFPNSMA